MKSLDLGVRPYTKVNLITSYKHGTLNVSPSRGRARQRGLRLEDITYEKKIFSQVISKIKPFALKITRPRK